MPTQIQDTPSHSFKLQYVILLCKKTVSTRYSSNFNDSGSLATVRDLPFLISTNLFYKFGGNDGCIVIQKEHVPTYQQAHNYLVRSIRNEANDVWNKGHSFGALRRNRDTGELYRPRTMHSTEMYISKSSTTTIMDSLASTTPTPEQFTQTSESFVLAKFIDMLTTNLLIGNQHSILSQLNNIPSLSAAGLMKYCMYKYGIDYAKTSSQNEQIHSLIQALWGQSPLPNSGLTTWNANIPALHADLNKAEANFPFIVKKYILRAIKPNHSEEDLFSSDTSRESLRKSLGHSEAGISLMNLVTLIHLTSKDDYEPLLLESCSKFLKSAIKTFSDARVNFTIEKITPTLENLLQENTIPTREAMRHFLAPVVYDLNFEDLTNRKQNTIRRLVRTVGLLSESLRPLIKQNNIPLSFAY